MPDLVIRPAVQDDLEILWDFLAMAAYEPHAEAAKAEPLVAKYLVGWQRPGDFGVIAAQHGAILGAAWARRFSTAELKSPYGDEEMPKVSIGVKPEARGQGVGEKLMRALIGEAARRGLGLCLSVRTDNPARRLYERLGFREIRGARCNWSSVQLSAVLTSIERWVGQNDRGLDLPIRDGPGHLEQRGHPFRRDALEPAALVELDGPFRSSPGADQHASLKP